MLGRSMVSAVVGVGRALVLGLPLWGGGLAFAEEPAESEASRRKVGVSITDDLEIRYWLRDERLPDPSDVAVFNYVEQVNRLNVNLAGEGFAVEAQVDQVALFANRYYLNDVLYVERSLVSGETFNPLPDFTYVNPEKLRFRLDRRQASLTLGDSYAAFGRGIALNLNRNVDIDVDTSIQGVKAVLRPGSWDVTLVAGQLNRQQVFQDNPNIGILPDLRHVVAGVRAEYFGLGPANLGAHGVVYDFVHEPGFGAFARDEGGPDTFVGGVTAELLGVAGIDWYGELDVFQFRRDGLPSALPDAADRPGYAGYLSAAFYPGRTVWLVEAKRYYQAERVNSLLTPELYEVGVAPTLEYERAITEDSSATVNSNDIWGARARVDVAVKPGELVPYASVAVFRDEELGGLHFNTSPETVVHSVVGVELLKEERSALINAGYRIDRRDDAGEGADRHLHADAAVNFPLLAGFHANVALAGEYYMWGNNPFQQQDYVEIETGWTIQRGSGLALTWYTDWTTNPLVDSSGNLGDPRCWFGQACAERAGGDPLYGALELQVKPTSSLTMKAFYGAYKAGIRCSGGQCRQLPGFEGGRFSVVGTF